jgi:hypothetical protein
MTIEDWAKRWNLPPAALTELLGLMGIHYQATTESGKSEGFAQQEIRLEAPRHGVALWRNNNGACYDVDGRLIRYGLANDSKAMNEKIKSHDLIGITPIIIRPEHIGKRFGVFTSIEVKKPGWIFKGTKRELAQQSWSNLVLSMGGFAQFATGKGDIKWQG